MKPLYRRLASIADAYHRCSDTENVTWMENHADAAEEYVKQHMPSGSGFDSGTTLDIDNSTGERLVFLSAFHHMHENGYYDGWSHFKVIVKGSLQFGFDARIQSIGPWPKRYTDAKDYVLEVFTEVLSQEVE